MEHGRAKEEEMGGLVTVLMMDVCYVGAGGGVLIRTFQTEGSEIIGI